MPIAQSFVFNAPLAGVPSPLVDLAVPAALEPNAEFDARWTAWEGRGRAQDAARRERLRTVGAMAISTAAFAGILRLSFGWFQ